MPNSHQQGSNRDRDEQNSNPWLEAIRDELSDDRRPSKSRRYGRQDEPVQHQREKNRGPWIDGISGDF